MKARFVGVAVLALALGGLGSAGAQAQLEAQAQVLVPLPLGVPAPALSLRALVQGRQAAALYPNLPTYQLGPAGLTVGVQGLDTAGNGRVGAVLLLAGKLQLSGAELSTLTQLVGTLATQCFNISPERLVGISDWLIRQNTHPRSGVQRSTFGPLELTYRPWQYTDTTQLASVVLSRRGTPGEEPWTSSCTL